MHTSPGKQLGATGGLRQLGAYYTLRDCGYLIHCNYIALYAAMLLSLFCLFQFPHQQPVKFTYSKA